MQKPKSNLFRIIIFVVLLALVLRIGLLGLEVLGIFQPRETVTVTLRAEQTTPYAVGKVLQAAEVIDSPLVFTALAKLKGAENRFFAATFEVDKGSGYNSLINTLTYDSGYRTTDITIPEGSTVKDIRHIVTETGYVTAQEFDEALEADYDYPFLADITRDNPLEGYLFPDTYNISNAMQASEIVNLMLNRFSQVYTQAYSDRARALGYSDDEILILASLIEGEAGTGNDRSRVSAVFHNRLNKPYVYPYLQSCASVQYILGEKKPILSMEDTRIDSPYNTYRYKGLPIGPICNPGKAAIEAALYPAKTNDYYFQSDAQGKIYYAETMQEHERMKIEIQQ